MEQINNKNKTMKPYLYIAIAAVMALAACGDSHSHSDGHETEGAEAHIHGEESEGHKHDEHEHEGEAHQNGSKEEEDHKDGGHIDGEIVFSEKQAQAVGLKTETVKRGTFSAAFKTAGKIVSPLGDEMTVAATASGIVNYAAGARTEGMHIAKGATVATVSAEKIYDGDPAKKALIAYNTAKKEYERAKALVKDNIISQKEFERIKMEFENAKTSYKAQANFMTANGIRVVAPTEGYVKNLLVAQGTYVSVGQPIATITKTKRLQLRADVHESHYDILGTITGANFKLPYSGDVASVKELGGKLVSVGRAAADGSSFVPVTFEFNNVGHITPGAFAEVWLTTNTEQGVVSVPVSAITEEQGLFFVYLKRGKEVYEKREISIGTGNGMRVKVMSGLNEGDRVVVKGAIQVKLASASGVIPHGHTH